MDNMVLKVARAIANQIGEFDLTDQKFDLDDSRFLSDSFYGDAARAAIVALNDPIAGNALVRAADDNHIDMEPEEAREVLDRMIAYLLKVNPCQHGNSEIDCPFCVKDKRIAELEAENGRLKSLVDNTKP